MATGHKYIKQEVAERTRRETAFGVADYYDEDTVECLTCGHMNDYMQFAATEAIAHL